MGGAAREGGREGCPRRGLQPWGWVGGGYRRAGVAGRCACLLSWHEECVGDDAGARVGRGMMPGVLVRIRYLHGRCLAGQVQRVQGSGQRMLESKLDERWGME